MMSANAAIAGVLLATVGWTSAESLSRTAAPARPAPLQPVHAAPKLTTIKPTGGPASGGTIVTMTGEGLAEVDTCVFKSPLIGSIKVAISNSVSGNKLMCPSPKLDLSGNDDLVSIFLSQDGGASLSSGAGSNLPFKYYQEPVIKRVLPMEGVQEGGEDIKVIGSGLAGLDVAAPENGQCEFEGVGKVPITSINADGTVLTCKSPPASGDGLLGPVIVRVALNGANFVEGASAANMSFHYLGTPKVRATPVPPVPPPTNATNVTKTVKPSPSPEPPAAPTPMPPLPTPNATLNISLPAPTPPPDADLPPASDDEPGKTVLTAVALKGGKKLDVKSIRGFFLGARIQIDTGKEAVEEGVILGFGSIYLTKPLEFEHPVGAVVVQLDNGSGVKHKEPLPPLQVLFLVVFGSLAVYIVVGFISNRKAGFKGLNAIPIIGGVPEEDMVKEPINAGSKEQ